MKKLLLLSFCFICFQAQAAPIAVHIYTDGKYKGNIPDHDAEYNIVVKAYVMTEDKMAILKENYPDSKFYANSQTGWFSGLARVLGWVYPIVVQAAADEAERTGEVFEPIEFKEHDRPVLAEEPISPVVVHVDQSQLTPHVYRHQILHAGEGFGPGYFYRDENGNLIKLF